MKKVYIMPYCGSVALSTHNHFAHSYDYIQTREQRDDRFEDYDDYDNDAKDFDNVAFWDE